MGLTRIRATQVQNLDYKQAARVATLDNITLSGGTPVVVDGVTLNLGDRVLVRAQDTAAENGIYTVSVVGSGSNGTWIRSVDTNQTGEVVPGMVVMVTEGDAYADTPWKLITNGTIIIGTTALEFEQFGGGGGGTPGGANTNIQVNSAGAFAGSNNLTWDGSEFYANGNANITGTVITGNIVPSANVVYDIGTESLRFRDLYLSGTTIFLGDVELSTDPTGNLRVGNLTIDAVAGTVPGGEISGQVGNALVAGTVYSNAQSNITSVGTLTALTVSGNISGGNVVTTGAVSSGTLQTTGNAVIGGNLVVNGNTISVNINDLHVKDPVIGLGRGANNAALTTNDGKARGSQLWYYDTAERSAFVGYNTATGKLLAAANVSISNELVTVNSLGSFVVGAVEATAVSANGNISGGNVTGTTGAFTTVTGNANATSLTSGTVPAARLSGTYTITVSGAATTAGTVTTAAQPNITSVGTLTALTVTGNITGGNVISTHFGSGAGLSSLTGANVTGTVPSATSATSATTAGTVTTAAQPNITSVGTLTSLAVTGNTTSGNFIGTLNGSGANVTSISATNISSGTLAQARLANASLTVNGTAIALGGSGTITATATNALTIGTGLGGTSYNGSTGVTITNTGVTSIVAGTNIAVSGATGAVTVSVSGTVASATTAGTVTTAAQPNITSVGTLSSVAVTGNATAGNFIGTLNGSGANVTSINATNISSGTLNAARLSGTYTITVSGSATTAGTVTTAAQPNITSVGTLSSLAVTGNTTSGNFIGTLNGSGANVTSINGTNISSGTVAEARIANLNASKITAGTLAVLRGGTGVTTSTGTGAVVLSTSPALTTPNLGTPSAGTLTSCTGLPIVAGTTGTLSVARGGTGVTTSTGTGAVVLGTSPTFTTQITVPAIVKSGTNGVGNIGAAGSTFNTVFAKATSAQYADLAEIYLTDSNYPAGTVVVFGGVNEVTESNQYADSKIAGVVSTNPAFVMNDAAEGQPIALQGRVPCRVVGNIHKGDLITSSQVPGTATRLDPVDWRPGSVIGKALENYNSNDVGVIEVVVGRM